MELITILNRCHRFRGFVYPRVTLSSDHKCIEAPVRPRRGSAAVCPRCHQPAPGYDQPQTVRGYHLKEAFQQLWEYNSPAWAGRFLDEWRRQTMRSRIEPMKQIARALRNHRELILKLFPHPKIALQRRRRGSEQQGQSHHE